MAAGTAGYEQHVDRFVTISQALDFDVTCKDFLPFLPAGPAAALDVGAGAGQNAAALAERGFDVTAVEPMPDFRDAAQARYRSPAIHWIDDSLPALARLGPARDRFDVILVDGVWHHIDDRERAQAAVRLAELTAPGGCCALSLRNGPAGMGTRVFPTDASATVERFEALGFACIFQVRDQPSILPGKHAVTWSRIVLERCRLA